MTGNMKKFNLQRLVANISNFFLSIKCIFYSRLLFGYFYEFSSSKMICNMYKITYSVIYITVCYCYYHLAIDSKNNALLYFDAVNAIMVAVNILFCFTHKQNFFFEFCTDLNKFNNTNLPAFNLKSNIGNCSFYFAVISIIGVCMHYYIHNIFIRFLDVLDVAEFILEYMGNLSYIVICDLYQNRMKSLRRMLIADFKKLEATDDHSVHAAQNFKNKFIVLTRCMNLMKNPQYTIMVTMPNKL